MDDKTNYRQNEKQLSTKPKTTMPKNFGRKTPDDILKNPAAVSLGRLGGLARGKKLSKERLSEIGKLGAQTRKEKANRFCGGKSATADYTEKTSHLSPTPHKV
jgi:hypothetical protein